MADEKVANSFEITNEFNPALCNAHKRIPVEIETDISL